MSKFKIGDKVRYLGPTDNDYINPGAIGTISSVGSKIVLCKDWSSCLDVEYSDWCVSLDEIELVAEAPPDKHIKDAGTHLVGVIKEHYSKEKVMPIIDVVDYPPLIGGTKNDESKPDLSLIPTDALNGMASALTFGAAKYQRHNFRNGLAFSRLVAATMRHLSAWNEGENLDKESSLSHLDHALASLAMLKFMEVNRQDMDDRYINPIHEHNQAIKTISDLELTDEEKLEVAKEIQNRGR